MDNNKTLTILDHAALNTIMGGRKRACHDGWKQSGKKRKDFHALTVCNKPSSGGGGNQEVE